MQQATIPTGDHHRRTGKATIVQHADQQVGSAITVDIASRRHALAKQLPRCDPQDGVKQATVLARVDPRRASMTGRRRVMRGADEQVGVPVLIDITRRRHSMTEQRADAAVELPRPFRQGVRPSNPDTPRTAPASLVR